MEGGGEWREGGGGGEERREEGGSIRRSVMFALGMNGLAYCVTLVTLGNKDFQLRSLRNNCHTPATV